MLLRTICPVFLIVYCGMFGETVWGASWFNSFHPVATRNSSQDQDPNEDINQAKISLANSLWLQHRVNDAWATLNQVPEDERRLEWRLANQIFRGTNLTLFGHEGEVTCLAFSSDGSQVVSGGIDGRVILWDATNGRQSWAIGVHSGRSFQRYVTGVTFSSDSRRVFCSTMTGQLLQLDIGSGDVLHSVQLEDFSCERAQYCDEGSKIAMLRTFRGFSIVDTESGSELAQVETEYRPILGLGNATDTTARSDARLLATTAGSDIKIWDVDKQKWSGTFSGSDAATTKVRFSPSGKQLMAANQNNHLLIWDFSNRRLVHKLQAPDEWFMNFAMSSDGTSLATSGNDGTLRVWDATTGQLTKTFIGHSHLVHQIEFSPSGHKLASASVDGTVRIWTIEGSSLLETIRPEQDRKILAISSDGKQAVSRLTDDSLGIWELATGKQNQVLSGFEAAVESVCFSPDGAWIATGDADGQLSLWASKTGDLAWQIAADSQPLLQVEFHPSGQQVATRVENGPVKLWNTSDGALVAQFAGHGGRMIDMAFSPDGESFATGDWSGQIQFWDLSSFQKRGELLTHPDSMRRFAYSPDGILLATIGQNTLSVWEVKTGRMRFTTGRNSRWFNHLTFAESGTRIVTVDDVGQLAVWSSRDGTRLFSFDSGLKDSLDFVSFPDDKSMLLKHSETGWYRLRLSDETYFLPLIGHQDLILSTAIDPAGERVISCGNDETVRVWDVKTGELLHTMLGHRSWVLSVAISPDGKLGFSAGRVGQAFLWDLATGQPLNEVNWRPDVHMTRARCSPDGTKLFGRLDDNLVSWDLLSGKLLKWIHYGSSFGSGLAISSDGTRIATVGPSYSVEIYNTSDWSRQTTLPVSPLFADALAFDSSGQRIATGGETTNGEQVLKVWDANNGLELMSFADIPAKIDAVCFSPDGVYLASGDQHGQITLRHLETGKIRSYTGHGSWIAAVKFSPDGSVLASSSADGSVLLMDLKTGKMRHRFPGCELAMTGLDFSRDGNRLAAVGPLNTLKVWDVVTGAELHGSEALAGPVRDVTFCADGKQVVAVGGFEPVVWDLESGKIARSLQVPMLDTADLHASFSDDGSKLSILDKSGKSLTWETETGNFLPDVQLQEPERDGNRSADGLFFIFPQSKDVGVHRF